MDMNTPKYFFQILYLLNELKNVPVPSSENSVTSSRVNERMQFLQREVERMAETQERLTVSHEQSLRQNVEVEKLKKVCPANTENTMINDQIYYHT